MTSEMQHDGHSNFRFIYDLPYGKRKMLCNLLDINDAWKELGGVHMEFNYFVLDRISKAVLRRESPTDELLQLWGNQNHTIFELYILLKKMKHYQAMRILKPYVPEDYHDLIFEGVSHLNLKEDIDKLKTLTETTDEFNRNNSRGNLNQSDISETPKNVEKTTERKISEATNADELDPCIPFINYKELEAATNDWNQTNILGRGGFGVVFKGIWKETPVAIKRLEPQKGNEMEFNNHEAQRQQSFRELKHLNSSRHDNVLPIYGYSVGDNKYCLIYQFMPNGSLEDRILCRHHSKPLPWSLRSKIAMGTARGLQFLHGMDPPLIHGDIKSANILLDPHFEPKIGDFGLAREGPAGPLSYLKISRVHGTRPYLPDEFLRSKKLSPKVDTYSFGVVLFELATGFRAFDDGRVDKFLRDYVLNYDVEKLVDIIDKKAGCDNNHIFDILIELGKKCVQQRPRERPEMIDVLKQLSEYFRQNSSIIPNPYEIQQLRYDYLQYRRPSVIPPPTGSYLPHPWLFETPAGSNQPVSIRRSPSPSNQSVPVVHGLQQVPEMSFTEQTAQPEKNETNVPTVDSNNPSNIRPLPDIKVISPCSSTSNNDTSILVSSVTNISSDQDVSQEDLFRDKSGERNSVPESENEGSFSAIIPEVTLLNP